MAEHDRQRPYAKRLGRLHIFEVPRAQEFGAHHPDKRRPAEQRHQEDEKPEIHPPDRRDDDDDVERRRRAPDLDQALGEQVGLAAQIPLHRAHQNADGRCHHRHEDGEQDRQPEAVDDAGQDVARGIIGAEPVVGIRRRGGGHIERRNGRMVIGDQRPDNPSGLGGLVADGAVPRILDQQLRRVPAGIEPAGNDQTLHLDIAIDGFCPQVTAECLFGIELEDRHVVAVAVFHQDRPVVREQLGEERQGEAGAKDNQRDIGPPVPPEILPAAPVHAGGGHAGAGHAGAGHDMRLSKSIRGSIQTYIRSETSPMNSPIRLKM